MKNFQKGFVAPLLIGIIVVLVIGGGVYVYETNKVADLAINDVQVQQPNQVQQTPGQNNTVNSPIQNTQVPSQTNSSGWKKYSDASISFEYPALVSAKQDGGTITLSHSVAYRHPNPCDFKGDAPPLDRLSDFGVSLKIVSQNLKDFVQSSASPGWDYVSKNPFTFGSMNGFKVSVGVEGCGYDIYYLTISSAKTLVIQHNYVAEFNSINADYQTYLNLPGIISPSKGEEYFNHILSTLKFVASPSTVTPKPLSITVISPSAGSVLQVGQTHKITWSGHFERGDEVFSINSFPVGSDVYGTIATVPIAQASCTGSGMGQWANPSTCSYTWTPAGPTPKLQVSIFNNKNGDQFGSSGIFSIVAAGANQTQPSITVLSPNGGENIPYGTIYMAGDLGFTWKTSLGTNYKPTSEFYAAVIDENNMVVRSDQINSKTNTGNGVYASSFIGESKIQVNKKYKIRVCDEIELRKVTCDESDNYFIIIN